MSLNGIRVLLGVTGGIAAYKSCELVRRLADAGAVVKVMMSSSAKQFVSELTFQALSGQAVRTGLFHCEEENAMSHIALARWADEVVIAPTSANTLAKLNHGFADDLLSTVCLATQAPVLLCPAMNQQMWMNQATQDNIEQLKSKGFELLGPDSGSQACGETGPGRMVEADSVVTYLLEKTQEHKGLLAGKKVLITAGPTREAIDPVRYISNHSSGKMGYALAQAAQLAGAEVTLVSGPTAINKPDVTQFIEIDTAGAMHQAVMEQLDGVDIMIAAAAVSDYRIKEPAAVKLKKTANTLSLELIQNPDIVAEVVKSGKVAMVVAFAAETCDVLANAYKKLESKKVNMVIANQVGGDTGFNADDNEVTLITADDELTIKRASKVVIARDIIEKIALSIK